MRNGLILVFILAFIKVSAQKKSFETVKRVLELKYHMQIDTIDLCDKYLFNGVEYEKRELNEMLSRLKRKDHLRFYLEKNKGDQLGEDKCKYSIKLYTMDHQPFSEKKIILDKLKENYKNVPENQNSDYQCGRCKAIMVNGRRINGVYKKSKIAKNLRVIDVEFIALFPNPRSFYYGSYSVNGIFSIYLKKKVKLKRLK